MSEDTITFEDLGLDARIIRALQSLGFEAPTPIQAAAIPELMQGKDIIGGARTGSGKTAAFGLPLVHHVREGGRKVRALVLAPTRELARQVADALATFSRHLPGVKILTIYGGVSYQPQLRGLKSGVSIVVGTPGRVIDHIERGTLSLDDLEMLVLDEADEMLQMGFIEDIEKVLELSPEGRRVALFSATMPKGIRRVAERYLEDPSRVEVESRGLTTTHVTQSWVDVHPRGKTQALTRLLRSEPTTASLVFARTRASVASLAEELIAQGFAVDALHGDLSQAAREMVLRRLRAKAVDVVVATDVAARGLDVNHISHVFNFDMPENSETYVHRIGRTARAGRKGWAITFVTRRDKGKLRRIERDLKLKIERMPIPTEAQISAKQRDYMLDELLEASQDSGDAASWVSNVLDNSDWKAFDLAVSALTLLAKERGVSLRPGPAVEEREERPGRAKPRKGGRTDSSEESQNERFDRLNEVELFFPVGRRDGLRPADFVGALCQDAGLPSDVIGRINLGGHRAFVGLPRRVAEELLKMRRTLELRGIPYPLAISPRSSTNEEEFAPRPRRPKHKKKHGKHRGSKSRRGR